MEGGCDFKKWLDPPYDERTQRVIAQLWSEKQQLANRTEELCNKNEELVKENAELVQLIPLHTRVLRLMEKDPFNVRGKALYEQKLREIQGRK